MTRSLPLPPSMLSSPPRPKIVSAAFVPCSVLFPSSPVMIVIRCPQIGCDAADQVHHFLLAGRLRLLLGVKLVSHRVARALIELPSPGTAPGVGPPTASHA